MTLVTKDVYRTAELAVHERWCGSSPSCGKQRLCRETQLDSADVITIVDSGIRAFLEASEPLYRKCGACDGRGVLPDPYRNGTCRECSEAGFVGVVSP